MLGVLVLIGRVGDDPVRAAGCLQCCARAAAKYGRPARSAPVVGLSGRAWECPPTFRLAAGQRPARQRAGYGYKARLCGLDALAEAAQAALGHIARGLNRRAPRREQMPLTWARATLDIRYVQSLYYGGTMA